MNLKEGVSLTGLRPEISTKLSSIEGVFNDAGSQLTLTCTTGSHKDNDPHPHGFAIDCHTIGIPDDTQDRLAQNIQDAVGPNYFVQHERRETKVIDGKTVITKEQHIHIQYRKDLWRAIVRSEGGAV